MTTEQPGLRERKKQATRRALREAALRLALEQGPDNVRVEDIAAAAGVSPRTYNNYFSSREQAIVAAVTAERETSVAAAVAAQPAGMRLAEAVVEAIVDRYTDPGERTRDGLLLITTHPALRASFLATTGAIEQPLADSIAARLGGSAGPTAWVLAASAAAAVRVGLELWLQPAPGSLAAAGLVIPAGSLPDLLRTVLAPLEPAFAAAEKASRDPGTTGPREAPNAARGPE